MIKRFGILAIACTVALAACGGGGSTASGGGGTNPIVPAPTATPAPAGNLPLSEAVAGAAAWVNPSDHKTLYHLDVDTASAQLCTSGCLSVWPAFVPVAGSANTDNMVIITRSDGAGQQWAYTGQPLYTYAGDSGADQANGDGIADFGGHWHVARPASVSGSTPTPPPGDPGCHGYC